METLWQSDNLGRQRSRKKRFQYPTFKKLDLEAFFCKKTGKSRVLGVEGEKTRFYSQFQIEDIAYPRFFFATSFWDLISWIFYRLSSILVSWNINSMWQGVVWRGVAPTVDMEGSRALGGSYWSKYRWRAFKSPASNLLQKQKACFWPRYLVEIRGGVVSLKLWMIWDRLPEVQNGNGELSSQKNKLATQMQPKSRVLL